MIPTTVKSKALVEKKREQIILAAIKLFAKKGFHKSTLRELAEEAGISQGNIYDYVGSKEDIFFLLHEYMNTIAEDGLNGSIEHVEDPLEKLKRMIRSEFNLMYQWADAILLIYQETHILNKPLLRKLLKRESDHVLKFSSILDECVAKGRLKSCNTLVVANLIKVMLDAWVLKRWDLRDRVTQLEMEKSIIDLVFHGLIARDSSSPNILPSPESLEGKVAFIISGATPIGRAICSFLLAKGARLAIYTESLKDDIDFLASIKESSEKVRFYPASVYGRIKSDLLKKMVADFGQLDSVILELGIGGPEHARSIRRQVSPGQKLVTNFTCAQDLSDFFENELVKTGSGRILYIAPWAWDNHLDPVRYETVRSGAITLTRTLAKRFADSKVTVNCIIPGYIGGISSLRKQEEEKIAELRKRIPMGCLGEMADVLETLYFLISDGSKYVTGQAIEVAGGVD